MNRLLRQPGYVRLAGAYALNELAWWVGTLALSILVYRRTGSVLGSAGFFLCAQAAPAFLTPPLVGRLDRRSPRIVLPALYLLEAVLYALLAWLTGHFVLAPVLALALVDGAVALIARSIASAARTEILKPADLVPEGSALTGTLFSVCFLAGPAVSGLIVAAGGTSAALLVSCGLFLAMGVSLVSRTVPERVVHEGPETRRTRAAIDHARRNPELRDLLGAKAVMLVLFSISVPLEVVFAEHVIHAGASGYGLLLSVWGGGAIVGSIGYARWRRAPARILLPIGTVLIGLGNAGIAVAPGLVVALIGGAFAGIGNGVVESALDTEVLNRTDQSWVALVSSLSQSLGQIMPGIGIILGAAIAAVFTVRIAFGTAAVGSILTAVAIALLFGAHRVRPATDDPGDGAEADPDDVVENEAETRESRAGTLA